MNDNRYIISNGIIADGVRNSDENCGVFIRNGAILVSGDRIERIGSAEEIADENAKFIDVGGRLILPGFLIPHHHLYSSCAIGLSPIGEITDFVSNLKYLWWKLDSVLDKESIYISALVGIIDAIKHGTTMIFDHHASMNFVANSLKTIAEAFELVGIDGILCFETSDRNGENAVDKHIRENIDFYNRCKDSNRLKSMFGLHANFTLGENTLNKIARQKPEDMPIHIHCGEDKADLLYCQELGYYGPVDRLNEYGLLTDNSILAHCIHLSERDYEILDRINPIVVANFESNAKNRVGKMEHSKISRYVLGTDGMTTDMIATLRNSFLISSPQQIGLEELTRMFFDYRYEIQSKFFPDTGRLEPGMKADLAVLNYVPITPISPQNLIAHLIFGVKNAQAYITISNGNILYYNGEIKFLDEQELLKEARKIILKLHKRYYG